MNTEMESALTEVENEIANAIKEGDAEKVDFYHISKQLIETHEMKKKLKSYNQPMLRNIIDYLDKKELNLLLKITQFDLQFN